MDRRGAIRLVGLALTGGCLSTPSATGPRNPPTASESTPPPTDRTTVRVSNLDVEEAADGALKLLATVVNEGETAQTRTLRANATIGEESYVETRSVRVEGDSEKEVAVTFDVTYDAFTGNGSVNVELR
ncbi:hypothetical protein ACFQJD_08895 [Haloplanus sp. GCM10025708]|uniref:hypothetical protein n=1 Tax=Haloferacaceae TaxID=1644056 RepID=UPI0036117765